MSTTEASRKIVARKRGNSLGFLFFKGSLRLFGLRGAYGLLYFVCAYYVLFDRAAVTAAQAYLRRRLPGHGRARRMLDVYRLFISHGKNLIDRYYLLFGGPRLNVRLEGLDQLSGILKERRGFVLLTAHLGNWQAVMMSLRRLGRKVHLVMRPEDNAAVAEALRVSAGGEATAVISPEGHLGGAVAIMEALKSGGVVSIMGARSYGYSAVEVDFLGEPARFSCGGFHIAALAQCPLVLLTSAKVSPREYVVTVARVFHPRYEPGSDKPGQLRGWVQEFAREVEAYTGAYPFQCFLFYDVWGEAKRAAEEAGRPGQRAG